MTNSPDLSRVTILVPGKLSDHAAKRLDKTFDMVRIETADAARITPELAQTVRGIAAFGGISAGFMDALPKLEIVASFGVGYDSVDAAYAGKKSVMVTNTPDVLTEEVADTALGLLINAIRELPSAENYLRSGRWAKVRTSFRRPSTSPREFPGLSFSRCVVGLAETFTASRETFGSVFKFQAAGIEFDSMRSRGFSLCFPYGKRSVKVSLRPFSIGVDVIGLVSLQWYFNGQPIPGANRGILTLESVTSTQVGRDQLRATLLGITLASVPTDVQINETDGTVDRSVAAFDTFVNAVQIVQRTTANNSSVKSGATARGFSGTQIFNTIGATKEIGEPNHCGILAVRQNGLRGNCPPMEPP